MPEVFVIDTKDTTMLIDGDLSLATESLDLRMTAHPHDFSPLALRTPVKVTGTFDDPHIRPEVKPLVKRGAAAAVLSLANPLAALLALVDFKQSERDVCTAAVSHVDGRGQGRRQDGPGRGAAAAGVVAQGQARAPAQGRVSAARPRRRAARRPARDARAMLTATLLLLGAVLLAMCLLELHVTRLPMSPATVYLAVGWIAGWMVQAQGADAADRARARRHAGDHHGDRRADLAVRGGPAAAHAVDAQGLARRRDAGQRARWS